MSKSIIVVDPERAGNPVVKDSLEWDGYHIILLSNPKSAVEVFKVLRPAMIITSTSFPGITGYDAMRMFRDRCPGVPVLMIAEPPCRELVRHWQYEAGFDVLPAPFTPQILRAKVNDLLATTRSRSAAG